MDVQEWFDVKVLYVEDDPSIREITTQLLQRRVRDIIPAENGIAGLELFKKTKPDIVITDIRMPVMNGLEMAGEIRKIDRDVKIIVTTAHNDTEYLINAIELGIDHYILKPIQMNKFVDAIRKCVEVVELRNSARTCDEEREKNIGELKNALHSKDMLIKEVYHRVKNNLQVIQSLLSLQSFEVSDSKTRELFDESQNRIQAISRIHEMLYKSEDLARVNLTEYLDNLVNYLHHNYKAVSANVDITMDVSEISLDIDTLIPCGLIVNELVSNALKYAFPEGRKGVLCIGIEKGEGDMWTIIVRDNGIGIPEHLDIYSTRSLGMQIVTSLAKQIGGDISLKREGGTEFKIRIKGRSMGRESGVIQER